MCHLLQEDCSESIFSTGLLASKACCFGSSEADCGVCRGHRTVEFQLFLVTGFCLRFYDSRNLWRKTLPLVSEGASACRWDGKIAAEPRGPSTPEAGRFAERLRSAYVSTCCALTVVLCACGCMFVEVTMYRVRFTALHGLGAWPSVVHWKIVYCPAILWACETCSGQLANDQSPHFQAGRRMSHVWQVTWWSLTTSWTVPQTRRKHLTNKSCQFWLGRWTTRHFESWAVEGFGGTSK